MVVFESLLLNDKDCWNTVNCFWSFVLFTCTSTRFSDAETRLLEHVDLLYSLYMYKEAPFKYGAQLTTKSILELLMSSVFLLILGYLAYFVYTCTCSAVVRIHVALGNFMKFSNFTNLQR